MKIVKKFMKAVKKSMKVFERFSEQRLVDAIKTLTPSISLIFYDLDYACFEQTINVIKKYVSIEEINNIQERKNIYLQIFCIYNDLTLNDLVSELNSLDISEFEFMEYKNKQDALNYYQNEKNKRDFLLKSVYVNKDENVLFWRYIKPTKT